MSHRSRLLLATAGILTVISTLATAVILAIALPRADRHEAASVASCRAVTIPVSLTPSQATDQQIAANYCEPGRWAPTRAVDVLTDGATYTRYWDWPSPQQSYSVASRILAAGRATLTYDRIGSGASSRPVSTAVTLATDAWILEQLLRWLQPERFTEINSWVHSYSAGVGIEQASAPESTPLSHLIITGYLHSARNPAVAARIYAANADEPRWQGLDKGWLTTKPGTRGMSFHGPNAEPAVIATDEQRKDVISGTAFGGYAVQHDLPAATNPAGRITTAVVVVIGDHDGIFCQSMNCTDPAAVTVLERPYYHAARNLQVIVRPAGHSLALDPSGATTFRLINDALAEPNTG